jgi:hypothetical protein
MRAMTYYAVKILISALLVVLISEIGRRNSLLAALIAAMPSISVLAMIWLYVETREVERVAMLASSIFWLVLPSLALFLLLPVALRAGWGFWPSLAASMGATVLCYGALIFVLSRLGVSL